MHQYTIAGGLLGISDLLSPLQRRMLIPAAWMRATFLLLSILYGSFDSQVNLMPLWLVFPIWMDRGLQNFLSLIRDGRYSFKDYLPNCCSLLNAPHTQLGP